MKNLLKLSLIGIFALFVTACSNDDDNTTTPQGDPTIAGFVAANADYSSLLAALERADLVATLDGTTAFTVFAPNNAAFDAFLAANNFASLEDVPVDVLTQVLLNHVVTGTNNAADLSTGYINSLATFGGNADINLSLFVDTANGVRINGVSTVTAADVPASNGVIHAVDTVIGIPTIVTQATANPDFSVLVEALIAATDANTDYVALLSGTTASPFTVFAPTNEAFTNLLAALGLNSLSDIPTDLLQTVLNYHVLAGANVRAGDLSEGQMATTFQGEDITISLDGGAKIFDATGMASNIIATDVQTGNGVVHAIDKVLLPQAAIDVVDPTLAGIVMMTADLSTLGEALMITGLDEVLNDRNAEFTVFTPTNAAFDTFLEDNGFDNLAAVPVDVLTQVVLNHARTGIANAADLSTGYGNSLATYAETENNLSQYINISDGVVINGVSTVVTPDVSAANGVAHIVDAVIGLPTVVTFAVADSDNFATLVAALTRPDQAANDYVGVLSTAQGTSPAPFTVFAPVEAAFADLLDELGANSLDDIDGATLTATLNLHVIAEANVRAEDLTNGDVTTLGGDITISADDATITDANGRVSNIIVTNVQAANGVVHAIDKVILPQL